MNSPKISISRKSVDVLNKVFSESDIYAFENFPVTCTFRDIGTDTNQARLRYKWLFGRYGFYQGISEYKSFRRRVDEFTYYGDYLHTLRQKINIIHSLIECNLDTDLPVHCSIKPYNTTTPSIIDFENIESLKQLCFIFHPGQTRAQGSAFLGDGLRNVLMFVNKKYSPLLTFKNVNALQIKTVDDLLRNYKVQNQSSYTELEYDFYIPGDENGIRYHKVNETGVLKCNNIHTVGNKTTRPVSVHSSKTYPIDTFIDMDKYCTELFRSSLNIYSNQDRNKLITKNNKVREYLTTQALNLNRANNSSIHEILSRAQDTFNEVDHSNNYYSSYFTKHKLHLQSKATHLTKEQLEYALYIDSANIRLEEESPDLNFNFINTDTVKEASWYVSKNEFKGICLVVNTLSNTRDFAELLMCIPTTFSMLRNQDSTVMVINCGHEYWKTGLNFKEYIFNKNFFNQWIQ